MLTLIFPVTSSVVWLAVTAVELSVNVVASKTAPPLTPATTLPVLPFSSVTVELAATVAGVIE